MIMWVLNLRTMGWYRMRNSGPGEMFRGFVSCDMMYREGLVSSYLVSISLPSPNLTFEDLWHGETGTPDTDPGWPRASPGSPHHVFRVFAECQISSSSTDTCRDDVCQNSRGFCLNKPPGVWHLRSGARKLKEMKLQVFTKICLDTNTYYVKLRVCWSRKVIILSNVNIYGRQHISNSSWWAVNFDPRLEEILQASVPCLLERESHLFCPSFILCEEETVKYMLVNDVLDDSDVMMITGVQGDHPVSMWR